MRFLKKFGVALLAVAMIFTVIAPVQADAAAKKPCDYIEKYGEKSGAVYKYEKTSGDYRYTYSYDTESGTYSIGCTDGKSTITLSRINGKNKAKGQMYDSVMKAKMTCWINPKKFTGKGTAGVGKVSTEVGSFKIDDISKVMSEAVTKNTKSQLSYSFGSLLLMADETFDGYKKAAYDMGFTKFKDSNVTDTKKK